MSAGRPWTAGIERLDLDCYAAVARTRTPRLDRAMARLSRTADRSLLWLGVAAGLALGGGLAGRHAATRGLLAVAATAALVNLVCKPLVRRPRPERSAGPDTAARAVPMPRSRSFPSGHTASAFAFAAGAGGAMPSASPPLHLLAAAIGYSRVHTGVHYPVDVVVGALLGAAFGRFVWRGGEHLGGP